MTTDIRETRSAFIEKIGMFAQNDGLPRIAGRVLGLLVWDGQPIAFGDLADQLQVSRASISTATRILEERRLINRTAKPGQRQDYFQLADNPFAKMLETVATGLHHAQAEIDKTLNEIPDSEAGIKKRVAAYSSFYKHMIRAISTTIDDLT